MKALLVSACLLGCDCKYSGGSNALPDDTLAALRREYRLIPVCPEVAGGLPTPRIPAERLCGRVVTRDGRDVSAPFARGAQVALALAQRYGCEKALLKERSPSCGSAVVYDGSFSGTLIPGMGFTAETLRNAGIEVMSEGTIGIMKTE